MYHYVRPTTDPPPFGYYHLDFGDFRAQLDHFADRVGFVERDAFLGALRGDRALPEDGVVLTFDDGLLDHHEWVLPELRSRGLWGVFFVPTAPLVAGRRLVIQRVHALLGAHPAGDLRAAALAILDDADVPRTAATDPDDLYPDRETTDAVRGFKRLVNDGIPRTAVDTVLDRLEDRFPIPTDASAYYLTETQVAALADAGMVVGAHSVTHPVLSTLSVSDQRYEVTESRQALDRITGQDVSLFAYPFGTAPTFTDDTESIVADAGFDAAFTTVPGAVSSTALADDPFALARRDCTAFPGGDSSVDLPG